MLGVGYTNILDTYLSPEKYRGTDVRFISHTRRENDSARFVHQLLHEGNIAFADNRSGNGGEIAGGYTFGYSLLRKWQMPVGSCGLRLLAGGTAELSAGFLYNTRGSNNPAQARFALQLKPTVAADFDFRIFKRQKRPFTLHYEASAPLCGLMFSPNYGQSYYEIFSRGNYDHNCVPTTVASTPSLRQMLTLDFRALHTTWRIGYLGDWRQASVHLIPVESVLLALVVEEAVVLVDGTPESLEVAARIVGILSLVDARRCEEQQRCKHYLYYSFHVSLSFKGVRL